MINNLASDRMKRLRARMGWSRRTLADKMGVTRQCVWKWEEGGDMTPQVIAHFDTLEALVELLGSYKYLNSIRMP